MKKDHIQTYTRWIKETEMLIIKCKEVITEHERDITEYKEKRDVLENTLFTIKTERYATKELRNIRIKALNPGAAFSVWTEQNKPKGDKKGLCYMIDIYKE